MNAVERDQRDLILRCPPPPFGCGLEVMIYNKRFGLWECPRCGSEFWRDGKKLRLLLPEEKAEIGVAESVDADGPAERPVDYRSGKPLLSYGYVASHDAKRRGSSKSGKRRRKKKFFKPQRWGDEPSR